MGDDELLILAELEDLSPIFSPLKSTKRIKYTCFNVSNNFLVFGATSGGLYVFRREPCVFLQLLPNKEGSVTNVAVSSDEKYIAFSSIKGIVSVVERSSSHGSKHVVSSNEHQSCQVTCLQWNESNDELYVGDDTGKVSIVTVSAFPAKNMFQTPSFVLMQLDSKIVQMDFNSEMLLVSTLTKCFICDTSREMFRQVGHKLRDGEFGACIYNTQSERDVRGACDRLQNRVGFSMDTDRSNLDYSNLRHLKLLCARPGSRVWEVAIDGTVISTHHFKEALAVAPRKIIFQESLTSQDSDTNNFSVLMNRSYTCNEQSNLNYIEQSFNFKKLYIILSKYLFTFKRDGLYVFDPAKAVVILWNNEITDIVDVKCIKDIIYVWSSYAKMTALNLLPLEKYLIRLYFRKKYLSLGRLCLQYSDLLKERIGSCSKLYLLQDLVDKLRESETNENIAALCDKLKPFMEFLKVNCNQRQSDTCEKLKAAACVINHKKGNEGKPEIFPKSTLLKVKDRSHSLSPDRVPPSESRGSANSLPDIPLDDKTEGEQISAVSDLLNLCEDVRANDGTSMDALVFRLFDSVLQLSTPRGCIPCLETARAVTMDSHLDATSLDIIANLFHLSLTSGTVKEWLKRHEVVDLKMYNKFILNNCSVQSLTMDFNLSKVLLMFSSVLNRETIYESVRALGFDCYFLSLMQILNIFQDTTPASPARATLCLSSDSSLINILNTAYHLIEKGELDKCIRYSCKIDLMDMLYLIFRFQDESSKPSGPSPMRELHGQSLFLSYLDGSLNRKELICKSNTFVEKYIIYCLQNVNGTGNEQTRNCECGYPCPRRRNQSPAYPDIGYNLMEKIWSIDPSKCLAICEKVPSLWKSLILLRRDEPLLSILPLIIQLGDLSEMEKRSADLDEKTLEISVRHLIGLKSGNCLNCGRKVTAVDCETITWSELGMLCVRTIGPKETLRMYSKYASDISSKDLDQVFYQAIIFSAIVEKHSKGLRRNVVDLLIGKSETDSISCKPFSDDVKNEIFPEDNFEKGPASGTSHSWGIKVDVRSSCAVCSLSLDSKVLLSEAGLIMFKCSHAFHSVCVRKAESGCPICN